MFLYVVVVNGEFDMVNFIFRGEVNLFIMDDFYWMFFYFVVYNDYVEVVKVILVKEVGYLDINVFVMFGIILFYFFIMWCLFFVVEIFVFEY